VKLHLVRLGRLGNGRDLRCWEWIARYRRDFIAQHWSLDVWRWRLCLIRRTAE
jgi:hypothetical protein